MKIVVATGGTGGHIYPAVSLIKAFDDLEDVLFVGSNNRMEAKLIPEFGYKFKGLNVVGSNGGILNKLKSASSMFFSVFKCIEILKDFRPDVVIGFGNYISVPVVMAAKILKIKTVIHEQNSIAGKANLFLAKFCDLVIGSYDENLTQFNHKTVKILGNPRASEAVKVIRDKTVLKEYELNENLPLVLIVMGSLGSESVNNVLMEYASNFNRDNYQVLIVTGEKQFANFKMKKSDYIKKTAYIDGLKIMSIADLIVMRSGATTCAEVCALKKASITIPSPYVPNNHQFINARTLQKANATRIISESELTAAVLDKEIDELMNNESFRKEMEVSAYNIGKVNASNDIINCIKEMII